MTVVRNRVVSASLIALMAVACGKRRVVPEAPEQASARNLESPRAGHSQGSETSWVSEGMPVKAKVVRATRLRHVAPAPFDIVLYPEAVVDVTTVAHGIATVRLSAYAIADEVPAWEPGDGWTSRHAPSDHDAIFGAVPVESLEKVEDKPPQPEIAPQCSRIERDKGLGKLATDHLRLVVADPADLDIALLTNGGSIEVLEERRFDGHDFQRIRQLTDNVELQGWIVNPIRYSWGTHACEPRKVYFHPAGFERLGNGEATQVAARFEAFGEKLAEAHLLDEVAPSVIDRDAGWDAALVQFAAPSLPASFPAVQADSIRKVVSEFREASVLFGVVLVDEVAVCAPHYVTKEQVRIEASATTDRGKVQETIEYSASLSDLGSLSMDGPRSTRAVNGEAKGRLYVRCSAMLRVLGRDSDSFHIMSGSYPIFGYHPDDATRWYTSLSKCEADLVMRPRALLKNSEIRLAQAPARLLGGC